MNINNNIKTTLKNLTRKDTEMKTSSKFFILLMYLVTVFPVVGQADTKTSSTWIEQNSGLTTSLYCASTVNSNTGWAAGGSSKVIRTTNGGATWTKLSVTANYFDIYTITALSENVCLVAGIDSTGGRTNVYRTVNGGANWTLVFTQNGGFIDNIKFKNSTTGFMLGDPVGARWSLWRTYDAGLTWDSTGLFLRETGITTCGWSQSLQVTNNDIWFGTNNSKVYHSPDFGSSWISSSTPGVVNTYTLAFANNIGFAGCTNASISSTDAGESWFQVTLPGSGNISSMVNTGSSFFYSRGTSIYNSSNYGTSFEMQTNCNFAINAIDLKQDSSIIRGWAVCDNGKLYAYKDTVNYVRLCSVYGYTYKDLNGNGIWDSGELPFPYIPVKIQSSSFTFYSYPNSLGFYSFFVPTGAYTISIPNIPTYYTCAVPNCQVNLTYSGQTIGPKNFALVPIPGKQDLEISLAAIGIIQNGFTFQYKITYKNTGTTTVSNNVTLDYDSRLTNVTSVPSGTISGHQIVINYSNIVPGEIRSILINTTIPVNTPLGSVLCATATVNPLSTDQTPYNNVTSRCDTVRGSYDPNDKSVNHNKAILPTEISRGDSLIYTIRFQNTGTASAVNIFLKDSLSTNLDWGTFQMISASHNYYYELDQNGVVIWHFDNIMLPDSGSNQLLSNGFVTYRIKPKTTLTLQDSIKNTGYIYFDFNPPIKTNTVLNVVCLPTGNTANTVNTPNKYELSQNYPNPFNPTTNIKYQIANNSFVSIKVYDILGKEVTTLVNENLSVGTYSVNWNASNNASGIYFYKLTAGEFVKVKKMILQK